MRNTASCELPAASHEVAQGVVRRTSSKMSVQEYQEDATCSIPFRDVSALEQPLGTV